MRLQTVHQTIMGLTVVAAIGFAAGPAHAGKVLISGQDADDGGHVSAAFGAQLLTHVGTGNTNGGSGILVLGGYTSTSATSINT